MRYIKFLLVPMLFVSLAFMNIGGCGGSGGGGNVQPTNPPPTDAPPTNPPPTNPPPTDPPPTDPPPPDECQLPDLDTNFSNLIFFFTEEGTDAVMGVTSDGAVVIITIVDFFDGAPTLNLLADVTGSNSCEITSQLNFNPDFEIPASGTCLRQSNGEVLRINQLTLLGDNNLGDAVFDCDSVGNLSSSSTINSATMEMVDIILNNQVEE